jgi:hypothetical protein
MERVLIQTGHALLKRIGEPLMPVKKGDCR